MKRICLLGLGLYAIYVAFMCYSIFDPTLLDRLLSFTSPISKYCFLNDPLDPETLLRIKWERMLKDRNPKVRKQAAAELGKLGYHAEPAAPALLDALNDDDWGVVDAAADALLKVDPKAAENAGLSW
jgi:hypothetical protein